MGKSFLLSLFQDTEPQPHTRTPEPATMSTVPTRWLLSLSLSPRQRYYSMHPPPSYAPRRRRYDEFLDILRTQRTPAGLHDRAVDRFGAPLHDGLYCCPLCGKKFVSVDFLHQHTLREHSRRDMYQSENQIESGSRGRIRSASESKRQAVRWQPWEMPYRTT